MVHQEMKVSKQANKFVISSKCPLAIQRGACMTKKRFLFYLVFIVFFFALLVSSFCAVGRTQGLVPDKQMLLRS